MSVFVVAQGRVENRAMLDEYVQKAIPTILAHGGRIVAVDESPEVVEGTVEYPRTVILEFASREAVQTWYASPEYQAIVGLRLEGAPGTAIIAQGFTPPG